MWVVSASPVTSGWSPLVLCGPPSSHGHYMAVELVSDITVSKHSRYVIENHGSSLLLSINMDI